MLIRCNKGWELPEREATPEGVYLQRRAFLGAGLGVMAAGTLLGSGTVRAAGQYPVPVNPEYAKLDYALTEEAVATSYNNFYEYGTDKQIARAAQALKTRPWTVEFAGMVEEARTVDVDTLIAAMPLEERLYRFRCVEAWAMAVPWTGFPLRKLVEYAKPLAGAKYVTMQTFKDTSMAPGQRQPWYPWPYTEGLTMAEATHDLAFVATGIYGKELPKQNGAPLRLVTPWKYGFKSAKSLVRFTFTDKRPKTFWEDLGPSEYGFWANVNPEVSHPRWSQASERVIGTGERRPTLLFNGYAEQVAGLYKGLEGERLFM
jgi:methionine sulfoxide reductase catalytic subunit